MSSRGSFTTIIVVGFMLFALFFGAGNLIFPVMLGQLSGDNFLLANLGFIVTGVGLPVLAIFALAFSGKDDVQALGSRVHPIFGVLFTVSLYLAIGPLFAIPRTSTVSFEIGIMPFISDQNTFLPLLLFTLVFFGVTLYFSLQSSKLVDIIGKLLTPLLLLFIGVLIVTVFMNPIGEVQAPVEGYVSESFFKGFQEGYLTMDALAAFVFGIIIINIMKDRGAKTKKAIMIASLKVASIAAVLLAFIYSALVYAGATSVNGIGYLDNGGAILASISQFYFGFNGNILLALIVIGACLTTSIGLITSCASYFNKLVPAISYKKWAVIFVAFSTVVSNFGLSTLIEFSVPVLSLLYPLAICLMVLTFLDPVFKGRKEVYQLSIFTTFIVSIVNNLSGFGTVMSKLDEFFSTILPWYSVGLGWILPAIVGGVIGYFMSVYKGKEPLVSPVK